MAVRHYAHQYTMRLTDEKNTDANVSSENSDMEDYYPLIHHTMNSAVVEVNARRRGKGTGWDETVRLLSLSSFNLNIITSDKSLYYLEKTYTFIMTENHFLKISFGFFF